MKRSIRIWLRWALPVVVVAIATALSACSTKKNTAASRRYQAFVTRYNVYFNGDEHYKETLRQMERDYEDDFSQLLPVHPAEARANPKAPQPSGSFTRSIEKAQKAIQLHSIKKKPKRKGGKGNDPEYKQWLKREEYNPFLHNAWMMMGRSQYLDGDFLGAASTFYYVAKHFTWLPATVTEAKLWQARCYSALDWLFEAETLLTRVKPDELTSSTLTELYNLAMADLQVRSGDPGKAIAPLRAAISHASGPQKTRLRFLLGQLLAMTGDNKGAYEAFRKVGGSNSASYRTKFNARIKQSEVYEGADVEPEVKALRRMTRYDRNKEYLDQIYYAIGNLYLSRGDTLAAIENYELAAEKSTRQGIDRALAQVKAGGLHYERHRYDLAQPHYSQAVPLLPDNFPDLATLKRRSDVLDDLAVHAQNVALNDSLLRLAAMPEEERLAVIDKIIEDLKRKEKEEAEEQAREEYLAQAEAAGSNLNQSTAQNPNSFQLNTDKSWYFYNTATRNAGRTDFQKRWGSRKLENDWRRRNKASFALEDFESPSGDDEEESTDGQDTESAETDAEDAADKEAEAKANDPHFREYYLRQIPMTDAEKTTAHEVIREGLYNQGLILKDRMEDYDAAHAEWTTLNDRYPDHQYRLDVYYNEYLMNLLRERPAEAEKYRQLILTEFPESPYAVAMADPNYIENLRTMNARQEALYDSAYDAYLNDRNAEVHSAYESMERDFPLSPLMPKFMFLHALAYVTENRPEEFNTTLRTLLDRYPDTDVTPLASSYLKGMAEGRKLRSGGSNMRSMLWDIRLTNDSTATGGEGELQFVLEPEEPHYLVLLFATDSIRPAQLLFDVARHNFSTYTVRDFDLEVMNFGRLGLLLIKGFENENELRHYRSLISRDNEVYIPAGVRPVEISRHNFELLLESGASFETYFRFLGEETDRETHEGVLPPDEYPSAGEMYDQTPEEETPAQAPDDAPVDVPAPEAPETPEAEPQPDPAPQPETPQPAEKPEAPKAEPDTVARPLPAAPTPPTPEAPKPAPKPETPKPAQKPAPKPAPAPAPAAPALPDYPLGSEGDEED